MVADGDDRQRQAAAAVRVHEVIVWMKASRHDIALNSLGNLPTDRQPVELTREFVAKI
jgi:hypothetical protein